MTHSIRSRARLALLQASPRAGRHRAANGLTDPRPPAGESRSPCPMSPRPSEDELIARYFAPLAGPGGLGPSRRRGADAPAAWRGPGADDRRAGRGRAFLRRRSAGSDRAQGAEGQPFRSRGQGGSAARLSAVARVAARLARGLAEAFADGLGADASAYGCPLIGGDTVATPGPLTLSDHRDRLGSARADAEAHRRQARRPALCHRHDRRRGDRPQDATGTRARHSPGGQAFLLERYLHARAARWRWPARWSPTPMAAWTSRTASSAT